jgi:uncharacterized protein YfdQ (DUF2303 family)
MTDDRAAELITELTFRATPPQRLEPGQIYAWLADSGPHKIDLTGDEYQDIPRRKKGTVATDDIASFAQYYLKHATEAAEVFASLSTATITAVLNAHGSDADWQDHRAVLTLAKTPQWEAWTRRDRQMMTQQDFAEHLEEHIADIAADGPVSAGDLLEIAQSFQAHTKVNFSSGKRLASGETQFVYSEQVDATAGNRGTIAIPAEFELGIRPFEDCDAYRIRARFRYRLASGELRLGYHLDDPAGKFRDAVSEVVGKAEDACSVAIMRGRPTP